MTTWFVSRHPGALDWARQQGLAVDRWVPHLEPADVQPGDTVAGTLPVQLASKVCARGARGAGRHVRQSGDTGRLPAKVAARAGPALAGARPAIDAFVASRDQEP